MASNKQLAANRRNARHSTGPRTKIGKARSCQNATKHGLTAETVIYALEDPTEYQAFQDAIVREFKPASIVQSELVLRLASLLWRLRRATTIETGLFRMQEELLRKSQRPRLSGAPEVFRRLLLIPHGPNGSQLHAKAAAESNLEGEAGTNLKGAQGRPEKATLVKDPARCFLRIANSNDRALELISRYETALWRQTAQILFTLERQRDQRGGSVNRFGHGFKRS
jgi:hypothetical protein